MSLKEWFYNYCAERDVLYNRMSHTKVELSFWEEGVFTTKEFDSVEKAKAFVDAKNKS